MQPDTMKLVKAWICILQCLVLLRSSTDAKTHVELFNCNDASGTFLISGNSWGKQKSASAPTKCTLLKYVLITPPDVGDTCVQDFMKHLSNRLGENITVWANDTSSLSCYKNIPVQCPATAVVICKNNLPAAALGQRSCNRSVTLNNGVVAYPSGTTFPSQAIFDCDSGYYLDTTKSRLRTCSSRASWYWPKAPAECEAYDCESSLTILRGTLSGNAPVFTASCNSGYKLIGEPRVTCTSATESTKIPICLQIFQCKNTISRTIQNGHVEGTAPQFTVRCHRGFQLIGDAQVTCTSNTTSTCVPKCLQIKCPALRPPQSGKTVEIFPGIVFYACNAGFKLVGTSALRCMANGSWSTSMPQCNRILCLPFAPPKNGTFVRSSRRVFGITEFVCNEGYALKGQRSSVCKEDGTWSSNAPSCEEIQCSALAEPDNGIIGRTSHGVYGVTVFACNEGYSLIGISTSVCKSDEKWSSEAPKCTGFGDVTVNGTPDANSGTPQKMFEPYLVGAAAGIVVGFATAVAMFVVWMRVKTERTLKITKESTNPFPPPAAVELIDNSAYGTVDVPAVQNECVYEHVSELS
ncbi:P-selectin-like isoform X2 [Sycon ciliatum]|uniref:P-selectin-like isoform X2 n=1 Tax=Sycon ciliatum TaxID=27933 RepID=UPI0031F67DFF